MFRGQNEQGMALAGVAYAKAMRRRRIMVATSSVGPGATNMVTAAAVAHANRLPLLLLAGDTFASRLPDPVLQQVEHFGEPSTTVNDAFRPVVRYWDRIMRPAQLLSSLPQAVATMLDPADCGPAFLGLPQDVQAEAYDFPAAFFEPVRARASSAPRVSRAHLAAAAALLAAAERPLIVAGGGVHYSEAEVDLREFAAPPRDPGRRDHGGQGVARDRRRRPGRPGRRDRLRPGEPDRRGGRRRARGRHAPAGTSRPARGRCSATTRG